MPRTSLPYRASLRMARGLIPLVAPLSPKLGRGHRGRIDAVAGLERWAATERDGTRPLVWFHASSVGEGLQACEVLAALRRLHPNWQYALTHFSPSAESLAAASPADVAAYLPYDLPGPVNRTLTALAPAAVVFAKLDLWPELACRATGAGCRVMLVAGTVRADSGRLKWPVRSLLAPGYRALSLAAAISEDDASRLVRLGVNSDRIRVVGDPRYDSVVERVAAVAPDDPLLRLRDAGPTMVAGSTWPDDERILLAAFAEVLRERPDARLIVVPHEPTERHLASIEGRAREVGVPSQRLSGLSEPAAPMTIVDRTGVLATLYGAGSMAYVGGAMGSNGIHSVLEPAAWGVPVAFGPNWNHSREAGLLLAAGGATVVGGAAGVGLAQCWLGWLRDDETRKAQGDRARRVVQDGIGAAQRTADLVASALLNDRSLDRHRPG